MNLKIEDLEKDSGWQKFQKQAKKQLDVKKVESLGNTRKDISRESLETERSEPPVEYEKMIQKLEADVRSHIRVSRSHSPWDSWNMR